MKKNILLIILSIVALLLAGTVGYLIAGKIVNNNEDNDKVKELSLDDDLVTDLIYPKDMIILIGHKKYWNYKNVTIETLGRSKMMYNAAYGLESSKNDNYDSIYSAQEIKNNFVKIFGPDVAYYDANVEEVESCLISKYDASNNTYIAYSGCGGTSVGYIDRISKAYKAEQNGEYIYVYEYVQSVWVGPEGQSSTVVYLLNQNDEKIKILNSANESNYEYLVYQLIDKREVDTYKWTFKKQSDGKYYFYSGAWHTSNSDKESVIENNKNNENIVESDQNQENTIENDKNNEQSDAITDTVYLSKCLNTDNIYQNLSDNESNYGLSMSINSEKTSITLSIDWNKWPLGNSNAKNVRTYQITGFTKNIIGTFIGEMGQSISGTTLFYLMEDGTVEYTPVKELAYDSQNITSKGVVRGVENISKLYNADVSTGFSGWRTTIGAKEDGTFYDLGEILMQGNQ